MRFFRVLAVLPALLALSLSADTIELKTGERIEGIFKQATSTGATIEVGGQSITIPLEKVRAIFLGDAPSRTVARTDAIPALPPPSKVLETQGARSAEALNALRGLRSVTNSGIAYIEYHKRVLDARVSVDKYLGSADSANDSPRKSIETAMLQYELASQAWSNMISVTLSITSIGKTIMEDPETAACATMKPLIDKLMPKKKYLELVVNVGQRPALLWACASAQVAQAEQLLIAGPPNSPTTAVPTANGTIELGTANSEAAEASRCTVVTVPPGAEVSVDGKRLGVSPFAFVLLKQGDTPRTVTVKMSGYKTVEKTLFPDGKIISIALTLEKH